MLTYLDVPVDTISDSVTPLRMVTLGLFSCDLASPGLRLATLAADLCCCETLEQLPVDLKGSDVLLTDLAWLNGLAPRAREVLGQRAAVVARWVVLTDGQASVMDQIDWLRMGANHFFQHPLDVNRLATLLADIHDRQSGPAVRVVLLDDEESSLSSYAEVLRAAGIDARPVQNHLLVMDAIKDFKPNVLLVDLKMPVCSVAELTAIVCQQTGHARLPVIFLAAMQDLQNTLTGAAAPQNFLVKPLAPDVLVTAVKSHALRYRSLQRGEALRYQHQVSAIARLEHLRVAVDEHAIISIADVKGNILHVNDRFCEISGYRREELMGQNHRMVKSSTHPPEFYRELWRTIGAGKTWHGEVCNQRNSGELYWVDATIVPFLDVHGKPIQYISIRTDITSLKRTEAALVLARESAERANHAKSAFISSMSHELRTPMNAILGFSQMLEYDSALNADQLDNVHEILKGGRHLLALINEVLDLAKIESGRIDLSLEPVELASLAEDCRQLIQPLAAVRQIALRLDVPPTATVRADRTRLKQVLLNLLSNAIKYNRAGGEVRLGVQTARSEHVRITVTDSGAGIEPGRMAELFQPFSRLVGENSEIEGTGIGLTITRQLVELMGGQVGVESQVGVGSVFWIELPTDASATLDASQVLDATKPLKTLAQQYRVLCIDDNPVNLKLIAQMLRLRRHIHVITAHTADLGIDLAFAHRPDLILLDINMPGMDGYQVLDVIKADARLESIPVIAVTANAMPQDIERGLAAGFIDYLTKPIDIGQFLDTIDCCLKSTPEKAT